MPTYEFRCPEGHEFEKFYRSIGSAESQAVCPQCGKPAERLMSAAGFAFKGSGFYLTDYGKNAHREKGAAPSPQADGSAGSDAAKSESKSDAGSGSTAAPASAASESKSTSAEPTKRESKAAEPKPAAPAKKSSDE